MKCIVPGTYQTLPLPNTILIIIMTTLVLPTASLTHTFLSMWPYWGFNREWEKGIYLSLHTAANLKSQYTFSSPKPFPAMAHQVFFSLCSPKKAPDTWLLLSLQDYQLHPKIAHPVPSRYSAEQRPSTTAVNYMAQLAPHYANHGHWG